MRTWLGGMGKNSSTMVWNILCSKRASMSARSTLTGLH